MEIQLIRNATIKLWFAGKCILIDPCFADKNTLPSFAGKSKNPIVDLPFPVDQILAGVDFILISHLHPDHFDEKAVQVIPKNTRIYCQPGDYQSILNYKFSNVEVITQSVLIDSIEITRTSGQHGRGDILNLMGAVSGFIFRSDQEETIYWLGDTVLCDEVKENIQIFDPSVIICHSGGNQFNKEYNFFGEYYKEDSGNLVMDKSETLRLCKLSGISKVIATHIGALDHDTVTRDELYKYAAENGIDSAKLSIPFDGECIKFWISD